MSSNSLDDALTNAIQDSQLRPVLSDFESRINEFDSHDRQKIHAAIGEVRLLDQDVTTEINRIQSLLESGNVGVLKAGKAKPDRVIHALEFVIASGDVENAVQILLGDGYVNRNVSSKLDWNLYRKLFAQALFWPTDGSQFRVTLKWKTRFRIKGRIGKFIKLSIADLESVPIPKALWPLYYAVPPFRRVFLKNKNLTVDPDLGPFLGTPDGLVTSLLQFSGLNQRHTLIDLGCGDGRILVTASKEFGCQSRGYETDPALCDLANASIRESGLDQQVEILEIDACSADVGNADVVFIFLPINSIQKLVPEMIRKMKPGAVLLVHEQQRLKTAILPEEQMPIISRSGVTVAHKWNVPSNDAGRSERENRA